MVRGRHQDIPTASSPLPVASCSHQAPGDTSIAHRWAVSNPREQGVDVGLSNPAGITRKASSAA